jgi:hypothetical protein
MRVGAGCLAAALLWAAPASAATKTVTFDDLPPNTTVDTQYEASHGVYWNGPDAGDGLFPFTRDVAESIAHSGNQIADLSVCDPSPCPEGFTASAIGSLTTSASTIVVYVGALGPGTAPPSNVMLTAFDSAGGVVGTDTTQVNEGQPIDQQLAVSLLSPEITSFEVNGEPYFNGISMDDLSITTPDAPPPPDIALRVSSDPVNLRQGDSVDVPLTITRLNGSNGNVSLTVSGLPPGMGASLSPNPVPGTQSNATLHLSAPEDAPAPGSYSELTITATPGAGAGSQARTAKKLVRIVENCEKSVRLDYVDARTSQCMQTLGSDLVYASNQTVNLNGLALTPQDTNTFIVIDKAKRTVSSNGKEYEVTPIDHPNLTLYEGPIDWNLGGSGDAPKQVTDVPTRLVQGGEENPVIDIFLFFRVERITVSLTRAGKAEVRPALKLGFWPFTYFGTTTVTTGFTTDNDSGSNFDALAIKLAKVTALGIELKDVSLAYGPNNTWGGGATVVLKFSKPYEISAAFGLREGDFDYLRGSVTGLNVAVGPGVFLQRLGFGVTRDPLKLEGSARFSAGPQLLGVQLVSVDGTFTAVLDDPWVVDLTGVAKLVNRFDLANAFIRYSSTGLFELGGDLNWDLEVASINGHVFGFVDGLDAASLEGSVRGCVSIPWAPDPCAGGKVIASTIGVAACLEVLYAEAGIGYFWGGDFDLFWGSCDLGRWRPAQTAAAHSSGTRSYRLKRGLRSAAFAVEGDGAAPGVTLTGPKGEEISVSSSTPTAEKGRLFAIQAGNNTTYIVVRKPSAGLWTLTDDEAVPITRVRQAFGLPPASVHVDVTGRGYRRTLTWRLRRIDGQRVRFVEVGRGVHSVITSTRARRGHVRFRPADGRAGKRQIVALVEQDGAPRTTLKVGSYRAPAAPRPARPKRVHIARRGSAIRVNWRAPRPGFRHAVRLSIDDGRQFVRIAPAGSRSIKVGGVDPGYGVTAKVIGLTSANGRGPVGHAAIPGRPPRLARGRWRITRTFDYAKGGGFRVKPGTVRAFRVVPGEIADDSCGSGRMTVRRKQRLRRGSRVGLAVWIVGRSGRREVDGARGVRVKVRQGGSTRGGRLEIVFDERRQATGELNVGGCRVYFEARR